MAIIPDWGVENASLRLAPPKVRYTKRTDGVGQPGKSPGEFKWARDNQGDWRATDGNLLFCVRTEKMHVTPDADGTLFIASVTAENPCAVELCGLEFTAECADPPWHVDRVCKWQQVGKASTVNDYGPLVVRWNGKSGKTEELRSYAGTQSSRISWSRGQLQICIYLDAAALHPRWYFSNGETFSTAAPLWQPGASMEIRALLVNVGPVTAPPAVAARFPAGAEAALVITDHCDYDDIKRLELFLKGDGRNNGWLGQGLRMTKGAFPAPSSTPKRRPAPTLAEPVYRELLQQLHADGSEIVPHGVNESGNVPGSVFADSLKSFAATWSPGTWIDHGSTLEYCYTMGGATNPEFALLRTLRENGISNLWSYHDVPAQACKTLNLFRLPEYSHRTDLWQAVRHIFLAEPLVAMHYLRSLLRQTLSGIWGQMAIQIMSTLRTLGMTLSQEKRLTKQDIRTGWGKIRKSYRMHRAAKSGAAKLPDPHTSEELAAMAAVVYPERGVPLHQVEEEDLLLFTSLEAVHLRDAYTIGAVNRLLDERGLHLGHCYLLNVLPYLAGMFESGSNGTRLSAQWTRFVGHLSSLVRAHRLWNPTLRELTAWMRDMQRISFVPSGSTGMTITNTLSHPVGGATLLINPSVSPSSVVWNGGRPAGSRTWGDWLAVWGDVPPQSQIVVTWK
jgi:hypothetical protein